MELINEPTAIERFLEKFTKMTHQFVFNTLEKMGPMYRSASRVKGTQSQLRMMAARGQWALEELEQIIGIVGHLYTFLAFLGSLLLIPASAITYLVVQTFQRVWLDFLQKRYPHLEFVKTTSLRTTIDTHRNQGIISLLLQVKGSCDPDLIMRKLEENVLERRKENKDLCYPHLRTLLTTRWGRYAWEKSRNFRVENHLVVGSNVYRGRPVSELNIQEYVSDIVSKYLPPEFSPWQLTVIPSLPLQGERFYLLIRIHHLLLSEDRVGLGDLLLLRDEKPQLWRRLGEDDENFVPVDTKPYQPLIHLYSQPTAIPRLYHTVAQYVTESWTAFKRKYDPLEAPDVLRGAPTLGTAVLVALVTTAAVTTEMLFNREEARNSRSLFATVRFESEKRQCTIRMFLYAVLNSLSPMRLARVVVGGMWWMLIKLSLRLPLGLFRECFALCGNAAEYPGTTTEWINRYWGLLTRACQEAWYFVTMFYTGPRILLEELILSHQLPKHQLQTVSLCGRKVVAWSDPVPMELIRKISDATGVTSSEILTNATSGALREYFRQFGLTVPDTVLATTRFFPEETLLATCRTFADGISPSTGGGVLCLALPTSCSYMRSGDTLAGLHATSRLLSQTRTRQPILYLMSLWQLEKGLLTKILPAIVVRLIFNYLTRRYAVSLTEVASSTGLETKRHLLWGQEVESAIYWRPPQANICLSLTMMSYGDTVRLGVMSDALLSPQHLVLASGFLQQLNEVALAAGVPRERYSPPPSPVLPPPDLLLSNQRPTWEL